MEENKNQGTTDFMKETIKQRPLNRRKLVRRTLITAAMAVIFGLVACVTFLLLEPVISNRLYPPEEPTQIVFVEEAQEDEILPEDMIADDSQILPEPTDAPVLEDEQIAQVLSEMKLESEDYLSLIDSVNEVAKEAQQSMVSVVGVTADVGWLDNEYESEGAVSGVIVADNGKELLILANISSIEDADILKVAFADEKEYQATIKKMDNNTGLAVLAIAKGAMSSGTLQVAKAIRLGSSAGSSLTGTPVIALGRPIGTDHSVCYGNITSAGNSVGLPDSIYQYMTTDIYGSTSASGVIINLKGQVMGVIDTSCQSADMPNLISAVGITELKRLVESLSNDKDIPYFGVYGVDVTEQANSELDVPFGAYITEIDMDSPAMAAGIQSGDVIIRMGDVEIESFQELVKNLLTQDADSTLTVGLMRQGPEGYTEMELEATLGIK